MKEIKAAEAKQYYDIITVGAGPAAASMASGLPSGLSVLLIDGSDELHPKPCGGLLAPDAQKLMAGRNFVLPKSVLVDPQIFSVKTIDLGSGIVRNYQRYYLNMDRRAFDRLLLSGVPDSVSQIKARCIRVEENIAGYTVSCALPEGSVIKLHSRWLVGADGASSIVRSTFYRRASRSYIAIQEWFPDPAPGGNPYYSCIFDPLTSDSCSWTISKNGHMIYGGAFPPHGAAEAFERQKERFCSFTGHDLGIAERREACLVISPRHMSDFVTGLNGAWLIGEAAGFISASSLEGISSAILSGSLLARAFSKAEGDSILTEQLYRRYTGKLRRKLWIKIRKHDILFTPWLRHIIMKSGIASIK